jgi:NAD(P)-dependent dehydrogenase (short-subunit alcohol dehydrogenase family)
VTRLLIRNGRVVDPSQGLDEGMDLLIEDGCVAALGERLETTADTVVLDAANLVVAPGFIETEMTAALNSDQRSGLSEHVPLGRLGGVQDVAGAVLFLASSAGNYITGETINVNGGMYMI